MSRIFDCFMFSNELDMLHGRLTELKDVVYKHVLVEMPVTHIGKPKPLYYTEHRDEFKEWHDKIVHVVGHPAGNLMPDGTYAEAMKLEHWHRQQAWTSIQDDVQDDDILWLLDADEIPSIAAARWRGTTAASLEMRLFCFAVNYEYVNSPLVQAVIARGSYVKKCVAEGYGLGDIRDQRDTLSMIPRGGWHLSWMGGLEAQRWKLQDCSPHQYEIMNKPEGELILSGFRYEHGDKDAGGGLECRRVAVDNTFPRFIQNHECPDNWFSPK